MNNALIYKRHIFLTTIIVLFSVIVPSGFIYAIHWEGLNQDEPPVRWVAPAGNGVLSNTLPQPCQILEANLLDRDSQIPPIGDIGSGAGEVPVYDNDLNRNMVTLTEALARSYDFTEQQDGDVQRTAEYLRLLCEKEYEEDHTLQHAWANLIGEFVDETQDFIHQGYNGNPAFVTSQEAYYTLVDIGVRRVFMQDIADSARLGNIAKIAIIERVYQDLFPNIFPTNDLLFNGSPDIAPDDVPNDLADGFYDNIDVGGESLAGGYSGLNRSLLEESVSHSAVVEHALSELQGRIDKQLGYEEEKLSWGRGFFSYEVCDLSVFVRNQGEDGTTLNNLNDADALNTEDRRNCRIVTPGSLIQDQTSFVFGTALRQMELNDEYEEWIAPNTLAVLSDILSFRGLNNSESRNGNPRLGDAGAVALGGATNISRNAESPIEFQNIFEYDENTGVWMGLESVNRAEDDDPGNVPREGGQSPININLNDGSLNHADPDNDNVLEFWANYYGPLPFEYTNIIDVDLYGGAEGLGSFGIGQVFFENILDYEDFLDI